MSSRDDIKQIHEKGLANAYNDAIELFNHSMIAHERDILDENERYVQARAEMIAAAILLSSEPYQLDETISSPEQQKKNFPSGNRKLPDMPGTSGNSTGSMSGLDDLFSGR